MVELTWTGSGVFSDPARNFTARPNTTHDFGEDRAEEYLGHQSDNWKRPEDEDSTGPETESSEEGEGEDSEDGGGGDAEGNEDEDAPLVERNPEQLTETERRIDAADYRTLSQVAGRLDDVDGRGSEDELRVALHTDVDDDRVDEAFAAVEADEN